jgi:hypothetical protein
MASTKHNPEKKAWKGRSYRKGGKNVRALRATFNGSFEDGQEGQCIDPSCPDAATMPYHDHNGKNQ